ncbi:MAG: DUF6702 family protein [Flavobacteriaceae bacterium]
MQYGKITLLLLCLVLSAFTVAHKFYVSVTQIEYIEKQQSVQIISRIFIDDLENDLRNQFDKTLTLAVPNESKKVNNYIAQYLKQHIKVKINSQDVTLNFLGKTYDADIAKCYLEIENIKQIKTFEISNQVLFNLFPTQKNIVKTKIYNKDKSSLQTAENPITLLAFQ